MATKKIYSKRTFLNREKTKSAFVIADVECETDKDTGKSYNYATLDIHDCSRKVTLEFYCSSKREAKSSLAKAKLLQKIINEFTEALENHLKNEAFV